MPIMAGQGRRQLVTYPRPGCRDRRCTWARGRVKADFHGKIGDIIGPNLFREHGCHRITSISNERKFNLGVVQEVYQESEAGLFQKFAIARRSLA